MRPERRPDWEPDDDDGPDPLPSGHLDPPRRTPPTAVGTATPRPPSRPYRPTQYGRGLTRLQRIARAALGTMLLGSGSALVWTSWIWIATVAGVGVIGAGALVMYSAARARSIYHGAR
jgi:hypothetical protein